MTDNSILKLENITYAYPGRPEIFKNLNFALCRNDHIGLYGHNGSGKTTLLRLIMGLEIPQSGKVLFHGSPVDDAQSLHRLRCSIGYVLQNSDDQLFSPTVLEDVAFGPLNLGLSRHKAKDRAMETLENLGLTDLADRPAHRLSGGEKKMVSIAAVLSMRPEALLLDEPTAFLDNESRDRIAEILRSWEMPRIVVSHDLLFLEQTASSLVRINNGIIDINSLLTTWPGTNYS